MIVGLDHVFPSLRAGRTMINVHEAGRPVGLHAGNMQVGSEDLCFEWSGPIEGAVQRLGAHGVAIEVGPVQRFGARGREGTSVYFRDPDGNLLELMSARQGSTSRTWTLAPAEASGEVAASPRRTSTER